MDKLVRKTVALPDGERVERSDGFEPWWETQNGTGFLDPRLLAPDLDQPRKAMNQAALAELHESIRTRGVRNALIITPRKYAPWIRVAPENAKLPFGIVSGHRRRTGALAGEIPAVPVRIQIYREEKDYRLDASLHNKGAEELTDIEEGWEIVRLQNLGCKVAELCSAFGMATPMLYARIHLTRLDPSIQKYLDPELPVKQRLGTVLGGTLGGIKAPTFEELEALYETFESVLRTAGLQPIAELQNADENKLRFAMQKVLYTVIRRRDLSSARALEFVREHSLKLEASVRSSLGGVKTQKYEPAKRIEVFRNLMKVVESSVVLDWTPEEWKRVTEYLDYEELEALIKTATNTHQLFDGIIKTLKARQATKKPTNPALLALRDQQKTD
jgi:hypothetical protein